MSENPDIRDVTASATATYDDVIRHWAARTPDAPALWPKTAAAVTYRPLLSDR